MCRFDLASFQSSVVLIKCSFGKVSFRSTVVLSSVQSLDWAVKRNLSLMYNSKSAFSFFCGSWNTGTNLDLDFKSKDLISSLLDRLTLEKFLRSQD